MKALKEKNLYINFKNINSNMIIVTGISGSGKTTLSHKLSNIYKYEIVSFDIIFKYGEQQKINDLELDILNQFKNKYPYFNSKYNKDEVCNLFFDFVQEYITSKNINIIFDGSQFLRRVDFEKIKDQRIVLKKTPFIVSIIRRSKRNKKYIRNNQLSKIQIIKEIFWLHKYNIKNIIRWIKDLKYFNKKIREGEVYYG